MALCRPSAMSAIRSLSGETGHDSDVVKPTRLTPNGLDDGCGPRRRTGLVANSLGAVPIPLALGVIIRSLSFSAPTRRGRSPTHCRRTTRGSRRRVRQRSGSSCGNAGIVGYFAIYQQPLETAARSNSIEPVAAPVHSAADSERVFESRCAINCAIVGAGLFHMKSSACVVRMRQ